jgi:hypothetical protein
LNRLLQPSSGKASGTQINAAASQEVRARIPLPDLADPRDRAVISVI